MICFCVSFQGLRTTTVHQGGRGLLPLQQPPPTTATDPTNYEKRRMKRRGRGGTRGRIAPALHSSNLSTHGRQ